jgi:hypothetical protein
MKTSLDIAVEYAYYIGMYLRTTKRHNKDGSIVEYYQLAETRWDPIQRRPTAHVIYNFGRANTLDREALLRLAQSIRGIHLRRDTVISQWFQGSKAAAASNGHTMHF